MNRHIFFCFGCFDRINNRERTVSVKVVSNSKTYTNFISVILLLSLSAEQRPMVTIEPIVVLKGALAPFFYLFGIESNK